MTEAMQACAEIEGLLPLYVGRDLEPGPTEPGSAVMVARHLSSCPRCAERARRAAASRRALRTELRGLTPAAAAPPRDLWPGLRARLEAEGRLGRAASAAAVAAGPRTASRPRIAALPRVIAWTGALASAAALVATAILVLDPGGGPAPLQDSGGGPGLVAAPVPGAPVRPQLVDGPAAPAEPAGLLRRAGPGDERLADEVVRERPVYVFQLVPVQSGGRLGPGPGFTPNAAAGGSTTLR